MPATFRLIMLLALLVTGACASLQKDFDPPDVTVENFRTLPGEGGAPRFEITLRVTNPNAQALEVVGISHSIELMGKEVMSGVTNEVPRIEAYGDAVVTVESGLKLFQLLRLLADLGAHPADRIDYRVAAKIDFAGLMPTQRVEQTGVIDLSGSARR